MSGDAKGMNDFVSGWKPKHPRGKRQSGRGGDSVEALRNVWMEGYERGRLDAMRQVRTAQHPDACEHGVRLKNFCSACAPAEPTAGQGGKRG